MGNSLLADLQASGASLFSHANRLLKLRFAENSGIADDTLLPECVRGTEALSDCYRYELDCLSASAFLELKDFFGQPVEIALLLSDGGERLLTGIVTDAQALDADGGFARYRLIIEPALAILAQRFNSRVFQDRTVPEIVADILDEHLAGNPVLAASFKYEFRLTQTYPQRSYCLEYKESDRAFIERLLREEGISYRFTHGPASDASIRTGEADSGTPLHSLIFFDAGHAHPQGYAETIRFHRTDGVETEDAIDSWEGRRTLQSGTSTLATYDYKAVSHTPASEEQRIRHGEAGADLTSTLESYEPQTLYYGTDPNEMERYAGLRQQARDFASKAFTGGSTARHIETGTWFELVDHPSHDNDSPEDREFLITGVQFEARNNLQPEEQQTFGNLLASAGGTGQNQPPYRNTFTAVRRHIPVVPAYSHTRHAKPTAPGITTATVVGPAGEEIYCDEHGRIKIQFHWQRRQDHPEGGADWDERSSTWVRVAMPSAGAQWGTLAVPRIGQEVLVGFADADIDRPVVINVLYNGTHRPPTFSGAGQLPANKTLSGHKSKEYKGARYNELLFDDSTGEIRTKLSSEHGKSQLNQGYLIHPRTDGKGEPRGEGFELRTDDAGALRGAKGLLLSADARPRAQGKQLDRAELEGVLKVQESLHKQLSELAKTHQADGTDTEVFTKIREHVENWEKGSNTQGGKPDPQGGQPIIAASAPAGMIFGSQANVAVAAESHIDLVSNQNVQMSAGRNWLARAAEGISLFAHRLHLKLIAGNGKVMVQAHNSNVEVTAAKDILLTALESMTLQAPRITLIANGVRYELGGGNITTQCSGTHTQKAGSHQLTGPGGGSVGGDLPSSEARYDEKFKLRFANGQPMAKLPAIIKNAEGKVLWSGVTNAAGEADILKKDLPDNLKIEFRKS